MFQVRLDTEDLILGYVSRKIRRSFLRILPGNRVKIETSRYDLIQPGDAQFLDSATRIRRINWFF
uniref:translational initiation factor 1 n=1 Tax=Paederia foetida TaxID=60087 RepID=UPI001FCD7CDC|nr:translational initiation factor 1 [Paederia foetida]UOA66281.1 translational initiation factor 1 [Paederia foetida]